ncbi:MAG: hypothetical protein CL816_05685 [Coxiellaceae bacterium]|nr:hypothetical protein [Coxiellaceae bacterium]
MSPIQQPLNAGAVTPAETIRDDSGSRHSSNSSELPVQDSPPDAELLTIKIDGSYNKSPKTWKGFEEEINTNNTCIQIVSFFQLTLMTLANEIPQLSAAITTTATQCLPGWGFACAMGLSALSSHQTYLKKLDQAELFYKQYTNSSLSDNDLEIIKGYWKKIHQYSKISEGTETILSCLYAIFSLATLALALPMEVGLSQSGNMSGYELTSVLYSIVGKVWNYVDAAGAMILAACGCLNNQKIHQGSQESPTKTSYNHEKINKVEEIKALFIFNRIMKEAKEAEQTRNAYFACFVATCTIAAVTTVLAAGTVATGGSLPVILFTTYAVLSLAAVYMRYRDSRDREKDTYNYDHFTIRHVEEIRKACYLKDQNDQTEVFFEKIIDQIKKLSQGKAIEKQPINDTQDSVSEDDSSDETKKDHAYVAIINRLKEVIEELNSCHEPSNSSQNTPNIFNDTSTQDHDTENKKQFYNAMLPLILQTASLKLSNLQISSDNKYSEQLDNPANGKENSVNNAEENSSDLNWNAEQLFKDPDTKYKETLKNAYLKFKEYQHENTAALNAP